MLSLLRMDRLFKICSAALFYVYKLFGVTIRDVASLLSIEGPSLSSDIVAQLREAGLKPEAARQRVSRAAGAVRRLCASRKGSVNNS
jgi:hypothetical protein